MGCLEPDCLIHYICRIPAAVQCRHRLAMAQGPKVACQGFVAVFLPFFQCSCLPFTPGIVQNLNIAIITGHDSTSTETFKKWLTGFNAVIRWFFRCIAKVSKKHFSHIYTSARMSDIICLLILLADKGLKN